MLYPSTDEKSGDAAGLRMAGPTTELEALGVVNTAIDAETAKSSNLARVWESATRARKAGGHFMADILFKEHAKLVTSDLRSLLAHCQSATR